MDEGKYVHLLEGMDDKAYKNVKLLPRSIYKFRSKKSKINVMVFL